MTRAIDDHEHKPERAQATDFMTIGDDCPPNIRKALDDYFGRFAKRVHRDNDPSAEQVCFHCGELLTGFMAVLLGRGGFTWGLAHGEGFCAGCRWPARAHHFVKDDAGEDVVTLRNFVLEYHPDEVVMEKGAAA